MLLPGRLPLSCTPVNSSSAVGLRSEFNKARIPDRLKISLSNALPMGLKTKIAPKQPMERESNNCSVIFT